MVDSHQYNVKQNKSYGKEYMIPFIQSLKTSKTNHTVQSQDMVIFRKEGMDSDWEEARIGLLVCCLHLVGSYLGVFTLYQFIEIYTFSLCAFLVVIF